MKGWRTLAWAAFVALAGVVQTFDWATVIPQGQNSGLILIAIGAVTAALRYITDTPVGKSS